MSRQLFVVSTVASLKKENQCCLNQLKREPGQLSWSARELTLVVNIEDRNPTRHDIILGYRTPLGSLHLVQSVTPLEVQRKDLPHPKNRTSTEGDIVVSPECKVNRSHKNKKSTLIMKDLFTV